MDKVKATLNICGMTVEVEAGNNKELFRIRAELEEMFGENKCGRCGSERVRCKLRTIKGDDYYSMVCKDCGASLSFGQTKVGNKLFPIRKLMEDGRPSRLNGREDTEHGGWTLWRGKLSEEDHNGDDDGHDHEPSPATAITRTPPARPAPAAQQQSQRPAAKAPVKQEAQQTQQAAEPCRVRIERMEGKCVEEGLSEPGEYTKHVLDGMKKCGYSVDPDKWDGDKSAVEMAMTLTRGFRAQRQVGKQQPVKAPVNSVPQPQTDEDKALTPEQVGAIERAAGGDGKAIANVCRELGVRSLDSLPRYRFEEAKALAVARKPKKVGA